MSWNVDGYQQRDLLVDLPPAIQSIIDEALTWLAGRMQKPLVVPPWHRGDDSLFDDYPRYDSDDGDWFDEPDEEWRSASGCETDSAGEIQIPAARGLDSGSEKLAPDVEASEPTKAPESAFLSRREPARRRISSIAQARVGELLVQAVGDVSLEDIRAVLRRGRPASVERDLRRELAVAITRLRTHHRVPVATLAQVLACDPATIWRQVQRGEGIERRKMQDSRAH